MELYLTHIFVRYVVCFVIGVPSETYPLLGLPTVALSIGMAYALRWLSGLVMPRLCRK